MRTHTHTQRFRGKGKASPWPRAFEFVAVVVVAVVMGERMFTFSSSFKFLLSTLMKMRTGRRKIITGLEQVSA